VQVPSLEGGRVKEVATNLEQLGKQGARKFILDLRYSGYGKPEDGVDLANLFLDKGLITYLQGQKQKRENFNADPNRAPFKNQQLVLLTNRGTAGAAEIAAAALLDNKRAEVVGEKTYGDAAIRKPITMDDGSAVLLAVAKYYSPSGKAIQDTGVTPGTLVSDNDLTAEAEEDPAGQASTPSAPAPPEPRKPEDDAVLKKAIELLTKGKEAAAAAAAGSTGPTLKAWVTVRLPGLPSGRHYLPGKGSGSHVCSQADCAPAEAAFSPMHRDRRPAARHASHGSAWRPIPCPAQMAD